MIMAPNLFFLRTNNRANVDEIRKAAATTDIMRMLIKYQNILWTVSKVTYFIQLNPEILDTSKTHLSRHRNLYGNIAE